LIILDASLMVEWLIGENRDSVARDVYDDLAHLPIHVPSHWPIEVSNALRSHIRAKKLAVEDFHRIMTRFDVFDLRIEPLALDDVVPLAQFSATHDLTSYDAAYVQLALRSKGTLATLDGAMRTAAKRLDIPLAPADV
jgi:predicted nucleic acid-binding protein